MPWDSGCSGSVATAVPGHHPVPPPQFSAAESAYPAVPPAGSSGQSPHLRRRTTSTGSSSESLVRQSLEFESQQRQQQQQQQQQQRLVGGMSARTMLFSQQPPLSSGRHPASAFTTSTGDTFEGVEQLHNGGGKSSSGPITADSTASAASSASSQQPESPAVVKRTHSLKDDLIKRFRSKFAGSDGSAAGGSTEQQQQQQQHRQQQHQLTRSRPGSLRSGSANTAPSAAGAATGGSGPAATSSVAVKVLPDKKLISKASSSENLSPSAAASDLNSLTSLVQRKRDRSQDSADSSNGSPPRRPPHIRKAPAPPPPPPMQAATGSSAAMLLSQAIPFPGELFPASVDESSAAIAACKSKPPSGRQRPLPSEESSEPEECRSRDSPVEDQHGSDSGGSAVALGHHRSSSFEFLQDVVQSRTAPKIRQPSAIRKISDSTTHHLDASRASPYGSSPPKTVSFNPTDEILTYDGAPSRKSSHHRQAQQSRNQQSRLSDNALIDIHGAMVDVMESIVSKQRLFLSRVMEGSISVANYRDNTKSLLTMQTRTIQKILDAIQANEKA